MIVFDRHDLEALGLAVAAHSVQAVGQIGVTPSLVARLNGLNDRIASELVRMSDPRRAPLEVAEIAAQKIGRLIGEQMPPGWLFCFILASQGDAGYLTYISNVERECMLKTLREFIGNLERGEARV